MKKLLISAVCLVALVGVKAQSTSEALVNGEYNYRAGSTPVATTYKWTLSGGSTNMATVNAATADNVAITWDNAVVGNNYTLTVAGLLNGCEGDDYVKTYNIVNQLSYTANWVQGFNTCPATTKNPAGGTDAAFDIQVAVNSGAPLAAGDQIRVSYSIDNVAQPAATVSHTGGLAHVPVTFADATNTTGVNIAKNIVVTGIAIIGRTPVSFPNNARPTGTVNILATPVIVDIY